MHIKNIIKKIYKHFKPLKYYKGCEDLPIGNFHKILETNNFSYLVRGWDKYKEIEVDLDLCIKLWKFIYNQYCKLSEDNEALLYYATYSELVYLQTRYYVVSKLLEVMIHGTATDNKEVLALFIKALAKWDYNVDPEKNIEDEISRLLGELRFSTNKIGLLESELENFDIEEEEKTSFIAQVVRAELALNKNNIDIDTTSVLKWIEMMNELKRINEYRRAS